MSHLPFIYPELYLWQWCTDGDLLQVQSLTSDLSQIDLNWQDPELSRTSLYRACGHGHTSIVQHLLKFASVDVNLQQSEGATPLNIACQHNHVEIVKMLLADRRIDVNLPNSDGASPLFIVCQNGFCDLVELLVRDDRVDVNQGDHELCSPLWISSQNGHLLAVQMLLASGREIDRTGTSVAGGAEWKNKTALQVASWASFSTKWSYETEKDLKRRGLQCPQIVLLLTADERDPVATRHQLRQLPAVRGPYVGELLALVVFLADSFARLKTDEEITGSAVTSPPDTTAQARRFFVITNTLPLELQMLLCNRVFRSPRDVVLTKNSEPAFRKLGKSSTWAF